MPHRPPETIRETLAQWANLRVQSLLSGGHRNRVWAVEIGGTPHIARLTERRSTRALNWELDLMGYLRAEGMRVPKPVPAFYGQLHINGLIVFSRLEGTHPATKTEWEAVAAELGRLHEMTRAWPQRPDFRSSRELLEATSGGDIELDRMPPDVVQRIRAAWRALEGEPTSVVHGDPGASNILMLYQKPGFIDWDEARIDASILDLADLPAHGSSCPTEERLNSAKRAANAWEAANAWFTEPVYARRRLSRL